MTGQQANWPTGQQAAAASRPRMSFMGASRRVFDLSLGEMLWSRRTIFMALVVGAPVVLALIAKTLEMFGMSALRIDGQRMSGFSIFGGMIWGLFLKFIVPVLGVFYGTALMADEVEDKTITYLFTRPIPRGAVLVGKFLAYLACTLLVVLPSVMIVYFLLVPLSAVPGTFGNLLIDLGMLALGLAVYGGVFAFVGAFFKRPLVVGLVFAFGWEQVVMLMPGSTKQFTIAFYLQALVPHAMPNDGVTSLIQGMFRETPPIWACLAWLFAYLVGFLWMATRVVERKEYILEQ
jgi:ABC-type transport system involved in multi-copper enzyme maturation permease subunit